MLPNLKRIEFWHLLWGKSDVTQGDVGHWVGRSSEMDD
jgi:hypothetical protein